MLPPGQVALFTSIKGVYFVQTIFLEGWTIAESEYHLSKVVDPKLLHHSKISFGKGLEWNLETTRLFNKMDVILRVKDRLYTNAGVMVQYVSLNRYLTFVDVFRPKESLRTDCAIYCNGDRYDNEQIKSIACSMVSSLFYVELPEMPSFYSCPEQVYLRLLCRVPTGLPLVSLLYKLRLSQTTLLYKATTSKYVQEQVVTEESLRRCKEGRAFSRLIKVEVSSRTSKLDVKLCTKGFKPRDISNSPYILQDLIQDSKIDCIFGRRDHQTVARGLPTAELALVEMDRLQDTMVSLIGDLRKEVF